MRRRRRAGGPVGSGAESGALAGASPGVAARRAGSEVGSTITGTAVPRSPGGGCSWIALRAGSERCRGRGATVRLSSCASRSRAILAASASPACVEPWPQRDLAVADHERGVPAGAVVAGRVEAVPGVVVEAAEPGGHIVQQGVHESHRPHRQPRHPHLKEHKHSIRRIDLAVCAIMAHSAAAVEPARSSIGTRSAS